MISGESRARAWRWPRALHLGTLLAIVVVGTGLRLDLLFQPMRYDESITFVAYASRPLRSALSLYQNPNNHLLHTLLVHISVAIFGTQPWAIRLPALIAGILMIPATYLMAAEFFGPNVGIVAAGFVASCSALIEYSTNARGYTILCVCFLLALFLAKRLTTASSLAGWGLFAFVCAMGFYTIPIMLFPFGTIVVWLVFDQLSPGRTGGRAQLWRYALWSLLLTGLLVFVLYCPVLVTMGWRSLFANPFVSPQPQFLAMLSRSMPGNYQLVDRDLPPVLQYALAIGVVLSLILPRPDASQALRLAAAAVLWCSMVLLALRVSPYDRVWLFLVPPYFALASQGWSFLAGWVPDRALVAVPLLALGLGLHTIADRSVLLADVNGQMPDGEQVALFLKPNLTASCPVVASVPAIGILAYYFQQDHLPLDLVTWGPEPKRRCFIVVVSKFGQSLAQVLADRQVRAPVKTATVIRSFDSATVYRVELEE